MMKKFALGIALGASLVSSAAFAAEQRPTYLAFAAPAAAPAVSNMVSPAAPSVAKRDESFGTIPLYIPIIGLLAVIGLIAAVSSGGHHHNGSPG
jgi:hypothetical protein